MCVYTTVRLGPHSPIMSSETKCVYEADDTLFEHEPNGCSAIFRFRAYGDHLTHIVSLLEGNVLSTVKNTHTYMSPWVSCLADTLRKPTGAERREFLKRSLFFFFLVFHSTVINPQTAKICSCKTCTDGLIIPNLQKISHQPNDRLL